MLDPVPPCWSPSTLAAAVLAGEGVVAGVVGGVPLGVGVTPSRCVVSAAGFCVLPKGLLGEGVTRIPWPHHGVLFLSRSCFKASISARAFANSSSSAWTRGKTFQTDSQISHTNGQLTWNRFTFLIDPNWAWRAATASTPALPSPNSAATGGCGIIGADPCEASSASVALARAGLRLTQNGWGLDIYMWLDLNL